jgi:iron complex transport system substrate-binding protein
LLQAGRLCWLRLVRYPAVFTEDLRPIVRDFYTQFYHQTPTDAQLEHLLVAPKTR